MKLLADECFPRRVAVALAQEGHEVSFAPGGSSDDHVLALATEREAALLTEDTDFGELVVRLGRPHFGVLLLRMPGASADEKLAAVREAVPELEKGRYVVKKGGRLRAR